MGTNTEKLPSELLKEAKPYDDDAPELKQFDAADPYRMLVTMKKKLDEGVYDNK